MNLIFIVSQPRAGSTMLQRIISNSPDVATSNEAWIALPILNTLVKPQDYEDGDLDRHFAAKAVQENSTIPQEELKEFATNWLSEYYAKLGKGKSVFLDKTPRYYRILPQLAAVFPDAKFVILKRDPACVIRSIISTWNHRSPVKLAKNHYEDLCLAPHLLQDFLESEYSDRSISLRYEDIISETQSPIRNLFAWLEIEFQESYLNPSVNSSLEGAFGDQLNAHLHESPKDLSEINNSKYIFKESFIDSYIADLGDEFLKRYGYSASKTSRTSPSFKAFKLYAEHSGARENYRIGHYLKLKTLLALDSSPLVREK